MVENIEANVDRQLLVRKMSKSSILPKLACIPILRFQNLVVVIRTWTFSLSDLVNIDGSVAVHLQLWKDWSIVVLQLD